jgi:hypothetical protein
MRPTRVVHLLINHSSIFSIMSHRIPTAKKPRRGAFYSREEITVLSKYKEEYKDQTTKPLRANVLRTKILVDIFNYWDVQGTLPLEEGQCGERVKVNNMQLYPQHLKNLTDGIGSCCLGSKQLAPE